MKKTKRTISILLTVVMLLGIFSTGVFTVGVAAETYNGKTIASITEYVKGNKDTAWSISSSDDLMLFLAKMQSSECYGETFILTQDIDLNPGWTAGSTTEPTNKWSSKVKWFGGIFDGQGYTISGMYVKETANNDDIDGIGMFGGLKSCGSNTTETQYHVEIKNFALVNSYFEDEGELTNDGIGAIVGDVRRTTKATIENVYTNAIIVKNGQNVGGIVGFFNPSSTGHVGGLTVKNCVFDGAVSGTQYVGGIVGLNDNTAAEVKIENCVNTGTVSANLEVGGILGRGNGKTNITNCVNTGTVQAKNGSNELSGDILGSTKAAAGNMNIIDCYWTGGTINRDNVAMNRAYKPAVGDYNQNVTLTGGPVTAEKLQEVLTANSFTDWKTAATTGTLATLMPAVATALELDTMDLYVQKSADGKAIRFVAVLRMEETALADYASLGFNISFEYNGKTDYQVDANDTTTTTVYEIVQVGDVPVSANASYGGTYFFVVEINGLDAATATDVVFNVGAVMTHKTNTEANESVTGTYTFAKYVAPEV